MNENAGDLLLNTLPLCTECNRLHPPVEELNRLQDIVENGSPDECREALQALDVGLAEWFMCEISHMLDAVQPLDDNGVRYIDSRALSGAIELIAPAILVFNDLNAQYNLMSNSNSSEE